jgi:hypothetical protein
MVVEGNVGDAQPIHGSGKFPFRKSRTDSAISKLQLLRNSYILNMGINKFFIVHGHVVQFMGPSKKCISV